MSEAELTLVREIQILRDENIGLREAKVRLEEKNSAMGPMMSVLFKAMKQIKYMANHRNPNISSRCMALLDEYHLTREKNGLKPIPYLMMDKPEEEKQPPSTNEMMQTP